MIDTSCCYDNPKPASRSGTCTCSLAHRRHVHTSYLPTTGTPGMPRNRANDVSAPADCSRRCYRSESGQAMPDTSSKILYIGYSTERYHKIKMHNCLIFLLGRLSIPVYTLHHMTRLSILSLAISLLLFFIIFLEPRDGRMRPAR